MQWKAVEEVSWRDATEVNIPFEGGEGFLTYKVSPLPLGSKQPALPTAFLALMNGDSTKQQQPLRQVFFPMYLLISSETVNNTLPCQHPPFNVSSKRHTATLVHYTVQQPAQV